MGYIVRVGDVPEYISAGDWVQVNDRGDLLVHPAVGERNPKDPGTSRCPLAVYPAGTWTSAHRDGAVVVPSGKGTFVRLKMKEPTP